jgi:hypothetical protein
VFGEAWASEIERDLRENLSPFSSQQGYDAVSTLGNVIERTVNTGDDGIIRHAIRVIDENQLWSYHWDVLGRIPPMNH